MTFVIGSRGSKLALVQTSLVADAIHLAHPEIDIAIKIIKTKGDVILDKPLYEIGDKGLFVKEIEEALLSKEIDLAVHSLKDMPGEQPEGLEMAVTPQREDARDVLVTFNGAVSLSELPPDAEIATGSLRRSLQMKALLPDVRVKEIRGNVETRIRKSRELGYSGVILAAAGLHRLGLEDAGIHFDFDEMLPAPAQGILGLETRIGDKETLSLIQCLHHEESHRQAQGERAFLANIGGGCHAPMGAYCFLFEDSFMIRGFYQTEKQYYGGEINGKKGEEAAKGKALALMLKEKINEE